MFNKLGLLALAAPLVNALVLNIPTNPTSGGTITVTWTFTPGDPAFSLELVNEQFHNSFAIGNNIQPELQSFTLTLPIVPVGDGYTMQAVNIGNINQAYSTTGDFAIGPNADSTAATASQTSTSAAVSSASPTASASATVQTSLPATGSIRPATSSGFGSTATAPLSGASSAGAASATAQNNPATSTSSAANSGALTNYKFGGKGAMAAALLSALAGAAVVVL